MLAKEYVAPGVRTSCECGGQIDAFADGGMEGDDSVSVLDNLHELAA